MRSAGRVPVAVPAMPWPAKMNGFRAPVRNPGSSAASARTKNLNLWISVQCMTTCPASMSQYAGRIHRDADGKQKVTVYDYLDNSLPMLERMFRKREKGYKAMGYQFFQSDQQTRLL